MKLLLAFLLTLGAWTAHAQEYPNKSVRIVLPFSAGGSSDPVARLIARHLTTALGQPFVVENRPGAGGNIGSDLVAKSAPDGYTLLFTAGSFAVNPSLYSKLPFDPVKDFEPVVHVATLSGILVAHPSVPAANVKELIALSRTKPGGVTYASAGSGTVPHLAGELFRAASKAEMTHVPYKGSAPALTDLIGGHTKVVFSSLVQTTPHIKSGKLRAIGVGGKTRNPVLPDVPTVAESGVPTYEAVNWWGIVAPAGTPPAIVEKLHGLLTQVQDNADVQKQFANEGASVVKMSTADFGKFMQTEMAKWERVVKEGGIKAE